jgi:hypothetical protein
VPWRSLQLTWALSPKLDRRNYPAATVIFCFGRRPRSRLGLSWFGGGRGPPWVTPIRTDSPAPPRGGPRRCVFLIGAGEVPGAAGGILLLLGQTTPEVQSRSPMTQNKTAPARGAGELRPSLGCAVQEGTGTEFTTRWIKKYSRHIPALGFVVILSECHRTQLGISSETPPGDLHQAGFFVSGLF